MAVLMGISGDRVRRSAFYLLPILLIIYPLSGAAKDFHLHIIIMLGSNAILTMYFLMLIAVDRITLGAAAFWGIGAYTSALLVTKLHLSFWLAFPLSGIITGMIGLTVGALIIRTSGVAFVVLTLVINMVFMETIGHLEFVGGWAGMIGIPRPDPVLIPLFGTLTFATKLPYYYLMLLLIALTVVVFYSLYQSRIGRAWNAIKLNEHLAQTIGIDVWKYRMLAFSVGSFFAGLDGSFFAHYFQSLEPNQFNVIKSIYIQIYGILGGLHFYISGGVVGSIIMTIVPELLRGLAEYEPIFSGILLVILVVFVPGGIMGLIRGGVCQKSIGLVITTLKSSPFVNYFKKKYESTGKS